MTELLNKYEDIIYSNYKQYFKIYWFILERNRNSKEVLETQNTINEIIKDNNLIITELKKIKNEESKKRQKDRINFLIDNINYLNKLFFSLIDDIIIKYICLDDSALFAQLIDNFEEYNNYNYERIKKYIEKANYYINDYYIVICDLSYFALKCGDLVMYSPQNGMDYIELKDGEKNLEIINKVLNGEDKNLSSSEKKQFDRIKKQILKHQDLDKIYGAPMYEQGKSRFFEYDNDSETYLNKIKKDIKELKNNDYIENKVDDNISYLIINYRTKLNQNDSLKEVISKYNTSYDNCYTYNEFILDPSNCRPYQLDWGKIIYRKLVLNRLIIFIRIDLKGVFQELKEKITNLEIRKATKEDYQDEEMKPFIIDGRIIYYEAPYETIRIGKQLIFRIITKLYTTKDTVNHYYNSGLKYRPHDFFDETSNQGEK